MKKVLYGTTALLAAGMFSAAAEAATPLKLTVGGYLNAFMGYTDFSKKDLRGTIMESAVNKFDVGTDGQVVFSAETKLDNGMKFGAMAELNISNLQQSEWLGDVFVYAESKYGKMEMGATQNAAAKMHHEVMDASGVWGTDKSKLVNWIGFADYINTPFFADDGTDVVVGTIGDMGLLDSTAINSDGNDQKISYFTPKFWGFQVGASYVPGGSFSDPFDAGDGALNSSVVAADRDFTNSYVVSAAYDGKMGAVTLGADVAFGNTKPDTGKHITEYAAGLDVGFSGFSIGAGYKLRDYDTSGIKDGQAFDVGIGYENGPYAISASWFMSKAGKVLGAKMPKFNVYQVSGSYKLGAGVSAFATFGYADLNVRDLKNIAVTDSAGAATGETIKNQDAWTVVTGLALTF